MTNVSRVLSLLAVEPQRAEAIADLLSTHTTGDVARTMRKLIERGLVA